MGVEANCRFRSMAYFDDLLTVRAQVERLCNTSLAFSFEIVRPDENGKTLIATGGTTQVVIDSQNRPVPIPDWIREILS